MSQKNGESIWATFSFGVILSNPPYQLVLVLVQVLALSVLGQSWQVLLVLVLSTTS
jgi:hypothetical protein